MHIAEQFIIILHHAIMSSIKGTFLLFLFYADFHAFSDFSMLWNSNFFLFLDWLFPEAIKSSVKSMVAMWGWENKTRIHAFSKSICAEANATH